MNRQLDLIDHFAELVLARNDEPALAEKTLEVVVALVDGRSAGVFRIEDGRPVLFASRRIDQAVLDAVAGAWKDRRAQLDGGDEVYVENTGVDPWLKEAPQATGPVSSAIVPVLEASTLVGLLYVDSLVPSFCEAQDLDLLRKFGRILAKAVGMAKPTVVEESPADRWESYLERTPVEEMEKGKLLLLLNRNKWNIARVARLMGVTRRTVYLKLERYGIAREKVRKTGVRAALRPAGVRT